jgi:hypothetical protein
MAIGKCANEYSQLKVTLHSLETFAHKAWGHGSIEGDKRLVFLLEQVLTLISMAKHHMGNIEKLMKNTVMAD